MTRKTIRRYELYDYEFCIDSDDVNRIMVYNANTGNVIGSLDYYIGGFDELIDEIENLNETDLYDFVDNYIIYF